MRGGNLTRPELKLACLRRIAAAELDEDRRMLLVDCVEMYLELNPKEVTEYSGLCAVRKNREVRKMEVTWSERMKAEGREDGLQRGLRALRQVVLSLLEQRFGPLPEETRERVEAISSLERLTRLGSRVLTARSLAALRLG
jgi:predicted transposase YdaD